MTPVAMKQGAKGVLVSKYTIPFYKKSQVNLIFFQFVSNYSLANSEVRTCWRTKSRKIKIYPSTFPRSKPCSIPSFQGIVLR